LSIDDTTDRRVDTSVIQGVTELCRALRDRKVLATPAESIEAVRALGHVDFLDRDDVYHTLRLVLTTRREDLPIFDELFANWWSRSSATLALHANRVAARPQGRGPQPVPPPSGTNSGFSVAGWTAPNEQDEDAASVASSSAAESRGTKDFATFGTDELDEVRRLAARLARRLEARPSRRWRAVRRGDGDRLDLRRTFRLSLKTGGDLVELARRERKLRRTKLIALCDVSGSMDLYSRFLLQFLYALQHAFTRIETFAFSTRLVPITEALSRESYRAALDELARRERGWSGGTKIGASIAEFVERYPRLVDRRTVVIVLSDGWDTGEPELLSAALSAIERRAGRIVWLNPLLGSPGYQPLTRGMQAALPHLDVFAPAHNLASLEALTKHLAL
jgi:uncharacterized protein with von Willebrand factor type A (vWA) domain